MTKLTSVDIYHPPLKCRGVPLIFFVNYTGIILNRFFKNGAVNGTVNGTVNGIVNSAVKNGTVSGTIFISNIFDNKWYRFLKRYRFYCKKGCKDE